MTMSDLTSGRTFGKAVRLCIAALSAIMLITLVVPTPAAEASAYSGNPCPHYAIQDVFDDPDTDWDRDSVSNSDELYNGLNPCKVDTTNFCAGGGNPLCRYPSYHYGDTYDYHYYYETACERAVRTNPHGDYDGDGVSNRTESVNYADPCSRVCPHPSNADLRIDPNGDWDRDGVSNALEVNQGSNPCSASAYNPCPHYTRYDINRMPYYDWDGDGISNINDHTPCHFTTTHKPHTDQRLPHVTTTHTPPGVSCPYGYPYYHPGNGRCYANPVVYR